MASGSPSGKRETNDVRSLWGPGLRILLSVGAGYIAQRLLLHPQHTLDSKLAQLCAAPTIPMSSLKGRLINREGELVLIKDVVVRPLSSLPATRSQTRENRLYAEWGEAVVLKTVEYTDQPKEFEVVFKGTRKESVSKRPFAIVALCKEKRFAIVKNVDLDHLPLEHGRIVKPLDPPVTLTMKHKKASLTYVASSVIRVNKVTEQSALLARTRLENVFGRLSKRNGMAEIEPCPTFPKKCFTMSRSEIEEEVRAQAYANAYPIRACSIGVGLVSIGLLFSGFYSCSSSS